MRVEVGYRAIGDPHVATLLCPQCPSVEVGANSSNEGDSFRSVRADVDRKFLNHLAAQCEVIHRSRGLRVSHQQEAAPVLQVHPRVLSRPISSTRWIDSNPKAPLELGCI